MSKEQETILRSSVRAFFSAFAKVLGFFIALLPALAIIGGVSSIKEDMPEKKFDLSMRADAEGNRAIFTSKPTLLEIDINGIIGLNKLTTAKIREMLTESTEGSLENGLVKGILLHINTPGGTVLDSDGIYRALMSYKEKTGMPIYAYVDGLCASGGMYIASAADKIYASESSLIGSVGVLLPTFVNVSAPLEALGVKTETITAGKDKDQMNPLRPWSEGEADNLRMITDYFYDQFVAIVLKARPEMTKEKLTGEYGARIFPAPVAKQLGYIDEANSSRSLALTSLATTLELGDNYQVVALEKENWIEDLFRSSALFGSKTIEHKIEIPGALPKDLQNKFLYYFPAGL